MHEKAKNGALWHLENAKIDFDEAPPKIQQLAYDALFTPQPDREELSPTPPPDAFSFSALLAPNPGDATAKFESSRSNPGESCHKCRNHHTEAHCTAKTYILNNRW